MSVRLHVYVGPVARCVGPKQSAGDTAQEINEDLCMAEEIDGADVWLPNKSDHGHRITGTALVPRPVTSAGVRSFERHYADALAVLRKRYKSVEVMYGTVGYYI